MKILDLTKENEELYFLCLEDWSDEIREAGDHKKKWFQQMKKKGLRVKLAADDRGVIAGMIQYLPIEHSFVSGEKLYFVTCIWVHGHPQGRGNFQKQGMGRPLLKAAEEDARSRGALGMAAWGVALPFWMRASWFRKQGYRRADRMGIQALLWKPFSSEARPPKWIRPGGPLPPRCVGKVTVTAFRNGWCPAQNMTFERAKRAAAEFGDRVEFQSIDTSDRSEFLKWGRADGLFIDGKEVRNGPPPSYEKIRKKIARRISKS